MCMYISLIICRLSCISVILRFNIFKKSISTLINLQVNTDVKSRKGCDGSSDAMFTFIYRSYRYTY